MLDGFQITNRRYIRNEREVEPDSALTHVLSKKYLQDEDSDIVASIPLDSSNELFNYFYDKNILLAIGLEKSNVMLVARVQKVNDSSCSFTLYDKDFKECGKSTIEFKKIRYIQFDTDYLNSIILLER